MSPPTRSCPVGRPGSIPISGPGGARAKGRGSTSYGVPSLYAGVYEIPTGGKDHQEPHRYDELYHVVSGQGVIQMDEEDREVGPGSVIFVRAEVPHRFHGISDDLSVLVFFSLADASGTNSRGE